MAAKIDRFAMQFVHKHVSSEPTPDHRANATSIDASAVIPDSHNA